MARQITVSAKATRKPWPASWPNGWALARSAGDGIKSVLNNLGYAGQQGLSTVITITNEGAITGSYFQWSGLFACSINIQDVFGTDVPPATLEIEIPGEDIVFKADSQYKNFSKFLNPWDYVKKTFMNEVETPAVTLRDETKKDLGRDPDFCVRLAVVPRDDVSFAVTLKAVDISMLDLASLASEKGMDPDSPFVSPYSRIDNSLMPSGYRSQPSSCPWGGPTSPSTRSTSSRTRTRESRRRWAPVSASDPCRSSLL